MRALFPTTRLAPISMFNRRASKPLWWRRIEHWLAVRKRGDSEAMLDCDPELYHHGAHVFTTHSLPSAQIERWVRGVARRTGKKVDWFWCGGRAVILCRKRDVSVVVTNIDLSRHMLVPAKKDREYRDGKPYGCFV